jgi:hypothetical protein
MSRTHTVPHDRHVVAERHVDDGAEPVGLLGGYAPSLVVWSRIVLV